MKNDIKELFYQLAEESEQGSCNVSQTQIALNKELKTLKKKEVGIVTFSDKQFIIYAVFKLGDSTWESQTRVRNSVDAAQNKARNFCAFFDVNNINRFRA